MDKKLCQECGDVLTGTNQKYCNRMCGNRAKNKQAVASLLAMAHRRRDEAKVIDDYAELPLARDLYVKVSLVDLDYVGDWSWNKKDNGYAVRAAPGDTKCGRTILRMHREIMSRVIGRNLKPSELVDHINHDTLDNRRSNLRICTSVQNAHNYEKYGDRTSRYKGVSWNKGKGKWQAEIKFDSSKVYIGRFEDEDYAAAMRDQWCLDLHGEFAVLNFDYV